MAESYLERKKRRDDMEELKNETIFGLMGGILLMLVGAVNWLMATGLREVACVCSFALGFLAFALAIAVPSLLKYPYKAFRFLGNAAGKAVFAAVLTVFYFLLVFPIGLFLRRKREEQGYFTWNAAQPKPRSTFLGIPRAAGSKAGKASYFGILYNLVSGFVTNGKAVLIPVVVILVILGLILFFVSSNVITAFIYTIF